nr:uncharacterized protein LOC120974570 [Aegilops tauschii subsp. strangulata]
MQLAEQSELLKKAQKEAEEKEAALLAEFQTKRSTWTDKEALLTAGFGEIEDMVDDFFPGHSGAANQAIEADREGRKVSRLLPTPPAPLASSFSASRLTFGRLIKCCAVFSVSAPRRSPPCGQTCRLHVHPAGLPTGLRWRPTTLRLGRVPRPGLGHAGPWSSSRRGTLG